jgi:hypothetical protein
MGIPLETPGQRPICSEGADVAKPLAQVNAKTLAITQYFQTVIKMVL